MKKTAYAIAIFVLLCTAAFYVSNIYAPLGAWEEREERFENDPALQKGWG